MIRVQGVQSSEYLELSGITEDDVQRLAKYRGFFERVAPDVVAAFYEQLLSVKRLRDKFMKFGDLERNKNMQQMYFLTMSSGKIDEDYIELRQRVGRIHAKIELAPEDYAVFYRFYMAAVIRRIPEIEGISIDDATELASSLIKMALFDMSLTIQQYRSDDLANKQREAQEAQAELAGTLSATSEELSATVGEFATNASSLANANQQTVALAQQLRQQMDVIAQVNQVVQQVSDQTHLLGLNAAIEAARAGDVGRGFGVVAEEIRHLASNSKQSAKEISKQLEALKLSIAKILEQAESVAAIGEEQAAGAQELAATVEHVSDLARDLNERTAID